MCFSKWTAAAFDDLEWSRIDTRAIVENSGFETAMECDVGSRRRWLREEKYKISTVDFSRGLDETIPALGKLFKWEDRFGYSLAPQNRNLDALRDGFEFDPTPSGRRVFELLGLEAAWRDDSAWVLGLLAIAHEYSRIELALGRRFFTLLLLSENSPLLGQTFETIAVPVPQRFAVGL